MKWSVYDHLKINVSKVGQYHVRETRHTKSCKVFMVYKFTRFLLTGEIKACSRLKDDTFKSIKSNFKVKCRTILSRTFDSISAVQH